MGKAQGSVRRSGQVTHCLGVVGPKWRFGQVVPAVTPWRLPWTSTYNVPVPVRRLYQRRRTAYCTGVIRTCMSRERASVYKLSVSGAESNRVFFLLFSFSPIHPWIRPPNDDTLPNCRPGGPPRPPANLPHRPPPYHAPAVAPRTCHPSPTRPNRRCFHRRNRGFTRTNPP